MAKAPRTDDDLIVCGACSTPLEHEAEPCPCRGAWGWAVPGVIGVNVEIVGETP